MIYLPWLASPQVPWFSPLCNICSHRLLRQRKNISSRKSRRTIICILNQLLWNKTKKLRPFLMKMKKMPKWAMFVRRTTMTLTTPQTSWATLPRSWLGKRSFMSSSGPHLHAVIVSSLTMVGRPFCVECVSVYVRPWTPQACSKGGTTGAIKNYLRSPGLSSCRTSVSRALTSSRSGHWCCCWTLPRGSSSPRRKISSRDPHVRSSMLLWARRASWSLGTSFLTTIGS